MTARGDDSRPTGDRPSPGRAGDAEAGTPVSLARGEILFRQDAVADVAYVVERGRIETYRERPDGTDEPVARFGAGEYFGERGPLRSPALSAPVRSTSARALETTVLRAYDHRSFRAWLAANRQVGADDAQSE